MDSPGTHYYTHESMINAPPGNATPKIIYKSEDGILICYGTTIPTDNTAGYAPGCLFIDVDSSSLAVNRGTGALCNFDYKTID
jgi:hypothetical protein